MRWMPVHAHNVEFFFPDELLLVCVVELVHPLSEHPVYDVIAAGVPRGRLMYHGDDFPQEGELLVL